MKKIILASVASVFSFGLVCTGLATMAKHPAEFNASPIPLNKALQKTADKVWAESKNSMQKINKVDKKDVSDLQAKKDINTPPFNKQNVGSKKSTINKALEPTQS